MDLSLQKKTLLLIAATVVLICMGSVFYLGNAIRNLQNEENAERARELADIVSFEIDLNTLKEFKAMVQEAYNKADNRISNDYMGTYEYEMYISQYKNLEHTEEFLSLYHSLRRLLEASNVDCFYLLYLDEPTASMVYLVDAGDTNV